MTHDGTGTGIHDHTVGAGTADGTAVHTAGPTPAGPAPGVEYNEWLALAKLCS